MSELNEAFRSRLETIVDKHRQLGERLNGGGLDSKEFQEAAQEYAELEDVAKAASSWQEIQRQIHDVGVLLADKSIDEDMRAIAELEASELAEKEESIVKELRVHLLPTDEDDGRGVVIEIRPGTGGDEAALFAADLMRMYQRYAVIRGWKYEILDVSETDLGGIGLAVLEISGRGVFGRLKFESGVHRVQRVPETEASGRIHTSAATVAVLPEVEEVDVAIDEKDLRIDTYRAQGAGGQHVNKTDSAVRITHLPTGIVVACQDEKSQHKNRARAMKILRAKIYDEARQQADDERAASRRSMVGSGDRSERIRTYNFPQGRVSDHRINLTLYKLERILLGEALDEMLDALRVEDQAQRLSQI